MDNSQGSAPLIQNHGIIFHIGNWKFKFKLLSKLGLKRVAVRVAKISIYFHIKIMNDLEENWQLIHLLRLSFLVVEDTKSCWTSQSKECTALFWKHTLQPHGYGRGKKECLE